MNIEREYPLHVAIWNNDTNKLAELLKHNKVSSVLLMSYSYEELSLLKRSGTYFLREIYHKTLDINSRSTENFLHTTLIIDKGSREFIFRACYINKLLISL